MTRDAKLSLQDILKSAPEARARIAAMSQWQQEALRGISCCWWNENCSHKRKEER